MWQTCKIYWCYIEFIGVCSLDLEYDYLAILPVVKYFNAESEKETAIKDNKNKSGIYRWKNRVNGKIIYRKQRKLI